MTDHLPRRDFLSRLAATGMAAGFAPMLPASLGWDSLAASSDRFILPAAQDDAAIFAAARKRFLFPTSVTYCNTGTLGAVPKDVMDVVVQGLQRLEAELPDWPYFQADGEPLTGYQQLVEYRAEAGAFIGAPVEEVAFTQNATMGMSFIANGLDLAAGDEVITTDQEHSGGIGGFKLRAKRHGVVVKELPLASALDAGPEGIVKLFADAITPRTKVVMISHITSGRGVVMPARELCALAHAHGALAIVDGAQAVGQIPVDVKALDCDAYAASPHKWLLAPKGTGILYVRRELQPRLWNTLASGEIDDSSKGAFRYMQYGTGSPAMIWGLRSALQFMNTLGVERVARWDAMLTQRLRAGLATMPHVKVVSPSDPRLAAGITTFGIRGRNGRELQDALWERKIRVRSQGEPGVRLSAHLYVSPADIDRVLEVVAGLKA
ncbi:MAG: aminotransferase class V-fold PLP-dependent enzyme [Gemmatimonadaceae bacterium]|nr:aminotransferase class V-fold PLP-dependent enzyme [Gemmatimonadaceae bacterium]